MSVETNPSTDYGYLETIRSDPYERWPVLSNDLANAVGAAYNERCWVSGWPAKAVESQMSDYFRATSMLPLVTSSGTHALTLALLAGIDWDDFDATERARLCVIVPAVSFSGSVVAVIQAGLIPVFADVDPISGVVTDETLLRAASYAFDERYIIAAVMRVQLHGHPCTATLPAISNPTPIYVDDMCQAHATPVNRDADFAAFSFNITKMVPAGEGGALLVRDETDYETVRTLRQFGEPDAWNDTGGFRDYMTHDPRGGNYRIDGFCAALAAVGWQNLPFWSERGIENADTLIESIGQTGLRPAWGTDGPVQFVQANVLTGHSWQKFRVHCVNEDVRDRVYVALQGEDLPVCRWQVKPLPYHPAYRSRVLDDQRFDGANRFLDDSFLIFTEQYPLWCQSTETVKRVGAQIMDIALRVGD